MPTPATSAQSYCTEAARAAALASHSAASLAAAAGFREAARLLRSSEALARAATASLLALPRVNGGGDRPPGGGDRPLHVSTSGDGGGDRPPVKAKRRNRKKKKGQQAAMEGVTVGPEVPPPVDGVLEIAQAVPARTLSPAAAEFVPGQATRVLAARPSRERSPRGARVAPASASPSASAQQVSTSVSPDTTTFTEGQAVVLVDLVSRADLVGKCGVVKSFDLASSRYAVCIDASGEIVKVLEVNLRPSVFMPGGGLG